MIFFFFLLFNNIILAIIFSSFLDACDISELTRYQENALALFSEGVGRCWFAKRFPVSRNHNLRFIKKQKAPKGLAKMKKRFCKGKKSKAKGFVEGEKRKEKEKKKKKKNQTYKNMENDARKYHQLPYHFGSCDLLLL